VDVVAVETACPIPLTEDLFQSTPQTQKARGIAALARLGVMASVPPFQVHRAREVDPSQLVGYFSRPCPMRPRHGFVDSREIRTVEEAAGLIQEHGRLRMDERGRHRLGPRPLLLSSHRDPPTGELYPDDRKEGHWPCHGQRAASYSTTEGKSMKHHDLTQEQLLALFDVAQAEPETRLLRLVVEHLDDQNTIQAADSVTKALRETGWREPLLSLPSEILPPLA
jgi:hypothetical protein